MSTWVCRHFSKIASAGAAIALSCAPAPAAWASPPAAGTTVGGNSSSSSTPAVTQPAKQENYTTDAADMRRPYNPNSGERFYAEVAAERARLLSLG